MLLRFLAHILILNLSCERSLLPTAFKFSAFCSAGIVLFFCKYSFIVFKLLSPILLP
ncbi:MAG: hypothetical protein ACEY3D_02660 [Rickettsia sp.]|uniref:hypothetical protein n=1 Tax=Rickettsia sp. TaxID=789 RepID=UPI0039795694